MAFSSTPSLADYVRFLYGIAGIPQANLPSASGTATDGTTNSLSDASQAGWTVNQWAGYIVTDVTQGEASSVLENDPFTLTFASAITNPAQLGDEYIISPDVVPMSLAVALETVNPQINMASPTMYVLAVYNLATDRLINYAIDIPNQTYFRDLRGTNGFRITDPTMGIVAMSSNQATSMSYVNPEQMRNFTLADLQMLKTPYGRTYMGIAQSVGTIWGVD